MQLITLRRSVIADVQSQHSHAHRSFDTATNMIDSSFIDAGQIVPQRVSDALPAAKRRLSIATAAVEALCGMGHGTGHGTGHSDAIGGFQRLETTARTAVSDAVTDCDALLSTVTDAAQQV